MGLAGGFLFDDHEQNYRDAAHIDDCDNGQLIGIYLGWLFLTFCCVQELPVWQSYWDGRLSSLN